MTSVESIYDAFLAEFRRRQESWYALATAEDLAREGVVPRIYVRSHPVPHGVRAIDHFSKAGMIQSYSVNISISCALASLPPGVSDNVAVGWIMKASGGKADPVAVRSALSQRGPTKDGPDRVST